MRGRAVRNPVASAAPVGIFASLYKCLPDGLLGAAGGGNQARVEVCVEVCMYGGGMHGEMHGVVAYGMCIHRSTCMHIIMCMCMHMHMHIAHAHAHAHSACTCTCTCT